MMPGLRRAALCALACLGGCGPDTLTPVAHAALTSRVTLGHIAVESERSVAAIVAGGQLFCAADGYVFAVLAADAAPSSITGQPSATVARACTAVSPVAVPVPPPSSPARVFSVVPLAPIIPPAP